MIREFWVAKDGRLQAEKAATKPKSVERLYSFEGTGLAPVGREPNTQRENEDDKTGNGKAVKSAQGAKRGKRRGRKPGPKPASARRGRPAKTVNIGAETAQEPASAPEDNPAVDLTQVETPQPENENVRNEEEGQTEPYGEQGGERTDAESQDGYEGNWTPAQGQG